jgi:hypothetical protein
MSDESSAPPVPDPVPAKPPTGVRPGMRPPPRKAPTAPQPPSNLKKYLVLGIIASSVLLVLAIGWRLYVKLTTKPGVVRNIKNEWEAAYAIASDARKAIFYAESKTWVENRDLNPEEIGKVKESLKKIQDTVEKYHELHQLARTEGKGSTAETQAMEPQLVYLKTWIWDANAVIDSQPPQYGGLFIPMYRAMTKQDKSTVRLKEFREKSQEIKDRKDPAEIEKTVAEIKALRATFAAIMEEADRLHNELRQGLTQPDLKKEQLEYLGDLEKLQSEAQMGVSESRQLISTFPRPEDLVAPEPPKEEPKEPPKETPPPKEEPPKEEPPKEEPPKETPPKETPPKEEPPKETPK